jgi:hypothetical protein
MPAKSPRLSDVASQQDIVGDASPVSPAKRLALRAQVVARTAAQKRFSKLLTDIGTANHRMRNVNDLLDAGRRAFAAHVEPVHRQFECARRDSALEIAKRLVATTKHKGFTATLRRFTTDFLDDFMPQWEVQDDEEFEPLYVEIFGPLEEEEGAGALDDEARDILRAMGMPEDLITEAFGVAADDSEDDVGAASSAPEAHSAGQRQRPLSKRQLAAEQTAESAKLAVRTLYRQLAGSLHPDRARDDAGRAVATERMVRANVAYAANDLQALLALPLETARESDEYLVNEADATVRSWCEALAGQLSEIKATTRQLEETLYIALGDCTKYAVASKMKVADIERNVKVTADEARLELDAINGDLEALRDDARFVGWLKALQSEVKNQTSAFDDDFGEDFEAMIRDAMVTYEQASRRMPPRPSKRKARR